MIGVIAGSFDSAVVQEFFELFKTPWEFYRSDRQYDVLLCAASTPLPQTKAKVVVIYGGQRLAVDVERPVAIIDQFSGPRQLSYKGTRIPIYGDVLTFGGNANLLIDDDTNQSVTYLRRMRDRVEVHIGYDLFTEIRILLTKGQPAACALIPTLDLHIAILRDVITGSGIPLIEIPPVPEGYRFLVCLTHDVDHPLLRRHKFDHTMLGFLYRATIGSLVNLVRRRLTAQELLQNCVAAMRLPFVLLGLAKDPWSDFDRYNELEGGLPSSFFVVPFKNLAGRTNRGVAPSRRATRYGAADVSSTLRKLVRRGCEVGLHGIDAWLDSSVARRESREIEQAAGEPAVGVRMHWLYYDARSPHILDAAGMDYDSTVGYNETPGYRAGTGQAYRPLGVTRLVELPLVIMDTALFYPSHLNLSPQAAKAYVKTIIDTAVRFGGCVTVNWHDRSIAPERQWTGCYRELIEEVKGHGAWFGTARDAVAWFRKRRSAVFEQVTWESGGVRAKIAVAGRTDTLPNLRLRLYKARPSCGAADFPSSEFVDLACDHKSVTPHAAGVAQ